MSYCSIQLAVNISLNITSLSSMYWCNHACLVYCLAMYDILNCELCLHYVVTLFMMYSILLVLQAMVHVSRLPNDVFLLCFIEIF